MVGKRPGGVARGFCLDDPEATYRERVESSDRWSHTPLPCVDRGIVPGAPEPGEGSARLNRGRTETMLCLKMPQPRRRR
jgi:hypothetical protein